MYEHMNKFSRKSTRKNSYQSAIFYLSFSQVQSLLQWGLH